MDSKNLIVKELITKSASETENTAEQIGSRLRGGEVIELVSDLGGGKTTFARGLARGAGSKDQVASPSFTIKREYRAPNLAIHHFDFYRLKEPGLIQHDLAEVLDSSNDVVVVEWADIVKGVLPINRLSVHLITTGEYSRRIVFSVPKSLKYLLEELK